MDISDILSLENSRGYDPRTDPEWTKSNRSNNATKVGTLSANIPIDIQLIPNVSTNLTSHTVFVLPDLTKTSQGFVIPDLTNLPVKHPFLRPRKNAPNDGNPVTQISQLIPKEVNLTTLLRNNGKLNTVKCIINNNELFNITIDPNILPNIDNYKNQSVHITQDMTITNVVINKTPRGWEKVFHDSMSEFEFIDIIISSHEQLGFKVLPLRVDIFNAFYLTPLPRIKVVIMGQDPYHSITGDVPTAHGLSFSVRKGNPIPPSLNNIYREIARSIPNFQYPTHGDLSGWAEQGVFMLNSCLTVNPHKAGSHGSIWGGFITRILTAIEQVNPRCIFVLWGKKAQEIKNMISSKSEILESTHPSPFSANRGINKFNGCDHFVKINRHLLDIGKRPIDWNLP